MSFVGIKTTGYDFGGFCSIGYDVCPHTDFLSMNDIGNIDCSKAPENTFYISGQIMYNNNSNNDSSLLGFCGCGPQTNYQNGPSYPISNCGTYNHVMTQQSITNQNNTSAWTYSSYQFDPWTFHIYKKHGSGGILCCSSK